METLTYILAVVSGILLILILRDLIKTRNRKSECKNWKVGDMLILDRYEGGDAYRVLKNSGKVYAVLKGWSLESIYVGVHDDNVYKIEWCELKENKSSTWRKNYDDAKKVMGTNPSFHPDVHQIEGKETGSPSQSSGSIDGKPIELLSEVECEVYLKKAIETEDYQTAEAIRKRMEHFR